MAISIISVTLIKYLEYCIFKSNSKKIYRIELLVGPVFKKLIQKKNNRYYYLISIQYSFSILRVLTLSSFRCRKFMFFQLKNWEKEQTK